MHSLLISDLHLATERPQITAQFLEFTGSIKGAAGRFDKLRADAQITLLRFRQLDERAHAIRESLKELDGFKNLFQIA